MADYKKIQVDIGAESSFAKLPAQVDIGDWSYFLAKSKKGVYQLLSNVCPHAMGEVVDWGNTFMCPDHGWLFEKSEGHLHQRPQLPHDRLPRRRRSGTAHRHGS